MFFLLLSSFFYLFYYRNYFLQRYFKAIYTLKKQLDPDPHEKNPGGSGSAKKLMRIHSPGKKYRYYSKVTNPTNLF